MKSLKSVKPSKIVKASKKVKAGTNAILRRVLNILGIVICVLLIPILVVNGTLLVKSFINPDVPPDFMGYIPLVAGNDDMAPAFYEEDLVIVTSTDVPEELEIGTIACFKFNGKAIIRRIVDTELSDKFGVVYITKGDADEEELPIRFAAAQVVGVYEKHYDGLGAYVLFMQSPTSILYFVVLPMMLLFLVFHLIDKKRFKDALRQEANSNEESKEEGAKEEVSVEPTA